MIAKSHSANRRAKEKTCALVRVCAFDNASKTIVIAHVCPCEFSEMPRCIVFDSWSHVVHQFPVQVLLFRSPFLLFRSFTPMSKGYWQIPVAGEDKHKTAFVTPDGCYEFLRMPFGMKNSGATLVRDMRKLL